MPADSALSAILSVFLWSLDRADREVYFAATLPCGTMRDPNWRIGKHRDGLARESKSKEDQN